ncbi:sensor histidine kinase [Shewanella sp. HL-SH5]|uniref:sensor histidine kinase n=1 Tax=Shewanella sp. HL-SH5 TaxID=3436241 RepID=UPI003EBC09F0
MLPENFVKITNALQSPHLLLTNKGIIVSFNSRAKYIFPLLKVTSSMIHISELLNESPDKIERLLKMWSRTQTPLPSSLVFHEQNESSSTYRCNGSAIRSSANNHQPLIMLQCNNKEQSTAIFATLNLKIEQLKHEIKERRYTEQQILLLNKNLEQSINERTAELQHKNQELNRFLAELKSAQDQIIRSERLASLGGMVAGVAHEINNPVGVCLTASSHLTQQVSFYQTLYDQDKLTRNDLEKFLETASKSSAIIESNLNRAASQIGRFKQLAVDQSNDEKRFINVKKYLTELLLSLQPYFENTSHTWNIMCDKALTIETYPGAIGQIITNLISNSMTHGLVDIDNGKIEIEIIQNKGLIQFHYKDNGIGIPLHDRPKVFDPFFTTKRNQGGSGLGMNIVYNLVTGKLGGNISIENKQSNGAYFFFTIPESL